MANHDFGLAQLFPLDQVRPLDLPAIAALSPSEAEHGPNTRAAVRNVLAVFANMMRAHQLTPVLCELAVISDDVEWRPTSAARTTRFVSLVDVYETYLHPAETQELLSGWVNAIRSLSTGTSFNRVGDAEKLRDTSFIVLNNIIYDTFSFRRSMRTKASSVPGKSSSDGDIVIPAVKIFEMGPRSRGADDGATASKSINELIRGTMARMSQQVKAKLQDCFLVIVPFSRPYLDAGDLDRDYRERIDEDRNDGDLFTSFPASKKDPGGCFFGIYHAPGLKSNEIAPSERRFFLQAQYILTLSALVEARRNLLLYHDETIKKNWGYLLHQVKHDIRTPRNVVSEYYAKLGTEDLKIAEKRLDSLYSMAELSSRAMKARTNADDAKTISKTDRLSTIIENVVKTLRDGANAAMEDICYSAKGARSLIITCPRRPLEEFLKTNLVVDSREPDSTDMFIWIGDLHQLICHEVINSARYNAATLKTDAGDSREMRWVIVEKRGKLRMIIQNLVRRDEDDWDKVRMLVQNRETFIQSTGLGQMRLGLSGPLDLGDLEVDFMDSDGDRYYQLSVPIGRVSEGFIE